MEGGELLTVTEPGGEPRLAATRQNGQVQLTLTGKQGSRYAIETSTALSNWISAGLTVTVTNRVETLIWANAGEPARYLRAVQITPAVINGAVW